MIIIREISADETFAVRWPVLRPKKPIETCRFDGDELPSTKHFGLFYNDKLAGVASVFAQNSSLFSDNLQCQLRGMAVLEEHRGKGYGETLVRHSEEYAIRHSTGILWFNARIVAVPFYEKCGYRCVGDGFEIGDIGLHFVMFRKLK